MSEELVSQGSIRDIAINLYEVYGREGAINYIFSSIWPIASKDEALRVLETVNLDSAMLINGEILPSEIGDD